MSCHGWGWVESSCGGTREGRELWRVCMCYILRDPFFKVGWVVHLCAHDVKQRYAK